VFHFHRQVGMKNAILHTYLPMKMEKTECSETSAYKIQTPGNYPEESIQHSEHGKRLKPKIAVTILTKCRFRWPRGLRRWSAVARLLRLWVRIPPGAWIFVCCFVCVLSGRGLCDELIIRPEESYRLWRVGV
jgi:hypothetical protein